MPSILFVCSANQFRSPLAAAFLQEYIRKDRTPGTWRVESAGTWTRQGLPIATPVLKAAARFGLHGLDAHLTRQVDQNLLNQFDLILVMEMDHLESMSIEFSSIFGRLMLLSEIADGLIYSIADPGKQKSDPLVIASELQRLIRKGGRNILKMAQTLQQARQVLVTSNP